MNKGRPPLPEGTARSRKFSGRVRPGAAEEVDRWIIERGITPSDAVREALAMWVKEQRKAGK